MYTGLHVKYPLFFSDFNGTGNFLDRFSKNIQIKKFMKIRPVGAELFHADRRTDVTKLAFASLGCSTLESEANNLRRNVGRPSPNNAALQTGKKK